MLEQIPVEEIEFKRCYRAFLDSDSLGMTLPPDPDYYRLYSLIIYQIKQAGSLGVCRVLIDCSRLTDVKVSQLAHFVILGLSLQRLGTEFVLVDAPEGLRTHAGPLLPGAHWIDSATGTARL